MDRDALVRAVLAGCITFALLVPGFLLSRGALGAPAGQSQRPESYLPLVVNQRLPPEQLTATAQAATATTTPGTATATATATGTATATATPTTTATATATPTVTPSPTSDAQATAWLEIVNLTSFPITFKLEGPTFGNGEIAAKDSRTIPIQTGKYKISVSMKCGFSQTNHDFLTPGLTYTLSYNCPG